MRFINGTGAVAALGLALVVGSGISLADPPGNNGTIKIDGVAFDKLPDNEPHVGCRFQVDFYGFDAGANLKADVEFSAQPPSGRKSLLSDTVFIGEDSNAGGGSTDGLDAEVTYDLSNEVRSLDKQPQQGYHIELTINADGSQGSNVKHKVFWVRGCSPDASGDDGGSNN